MEFRRKLPRPLQILMYRSTGVSLGFVSVHTLPALLFSLMVSPRGTRLMSGLTAQQSMACVVIGAIITGMLSVVSGMPGEIHHIGFTVISRCSWGMKGSYFVCPASCLADLSLFASESSRLSGGSASSPTGVAKLSIWYVKHAIPSNGRCSEQCPPRGSIKRLPFRHLQRSPSKTSSVWSCGTSCTFLSSWSHLRDFNGLSSSHLRLSFAP